MASPSDPVLHVVLVEPEIPPNTGSVARLCAANALRLHLVGPLGFTIDDKHLKRAGLDYWPHVDARVYPSWAEFEARSPPARRLFYSARAERSYLDVHYRPGDWLFFGGESRGLPREVLAAHRSATFAIPMRTREVRSLNLSNAVSIVVYEALRQIAA
jgi:tRNA (cytidine/uridine-2'-O-)-methyltransferase